MNQRISIAGLISASLLIVPAFASASFDVNLKYGDTGGEVTKMQQFLAAQGHFTGEVTGNFYATTLAAVQAFQTKHFISPTSGYWGPLTRAKANAIVAAGGSTGSNVSTGGSSTQTSEIQALLQQIAALQAQMQAYQSGSSSNTSTNVNTNTSTSNTSETSTTATATESTGEPTNLPLSIFVTFASISPPKPAGMPVAGSVRIGWQGGPGNVNGWLGLYDPVGQNYVGWVYTSGTQKVPASGGGYKSGSVIIDGMLVAGRTYYAYFHIAGSSAGAAYDDITVTPLPGTTQ